MTMTAQNSAGFETLAGTTADPVILTVIDGAMQVLLIQRTEEPFKGQWALPGGFVDHAPESREEPHETAARKLEEKTGMKPVYMEQLGTYTAKDRDPRGQIWSVAYLALVPAKSLGAQPRGEAAWHPVDDLPPLAFDHARIIADGVERVRGKLWYSNIAMGLLPRRFTLAEAQQVYEAITGIAYDRPNFRRDLKASGLVRGTGKTAANRPSPKQAELYEWVSRKPEWVSRKGA